jgi:hypothetical protein
MLGLLVSIYFGGFRSAWGAEASAIRTTILATARKQACSHTRQTPWPSASGYLKGTLLRCRRRLGVHSLPCQWPCRFSLRRVRGAVLGQVDE